jgi:hypothetical protein
MQCNVVQGKKASSDWYAVFLLATFFFSLLLSSELILAWFILSFITQGPNVSGMSYPVAWISVIHLLWESYQALRRDVSFPQLHLPSLLVGTQQDQTIPSLKGGSKSAGRHT